MLLGDGREWNKYVTYVTEEAQGNHFDDIGDSRGKFVARATDDFYMNTDDSFFNGYVTISPAWLDRRQTTAVRQELFRSARKDDQIASARSFQYFEKKTEQSNSESWHRCFVQNLRLLIIGQFEHGWLFFAKRRRSLEEIFVLRGFTLCWYHFDLRSIQGFSGGKQINLTLQDKVLLPSAFDEHIYHVGGSHDTHSIIQSGLISGGKDVKNGRHAEFLSAMKPLFVDHHRERDYDVTKPRMVVYKHNWKTHPKHSLLI